jgi:catalase
MFDAIVIPGGKASVASLSANGRALHYVREAFGHLKAIAATGEAVDFVNKALQLPQITTSSGHEAHESYGVVTLREAKPEHLGDVVTVAKEAKGFLEKFVYAVSQHRCWQRELDGLNMMVAY